MCRALPSKQSECSWTSLWNTYVSPKSQISLQPHSIKLWTSLKIIYNCLDVAVTSLIPFKSHVRHFSCRTLQSYNSPGDWARELFKPSTDSTSLVVKIEKNNFLFRWGFSGGDVTKRTCFGKVGHLWPALGPKPLTHFFGSKFCCKLDENSRL